MVALPGSLVTRVSDGEHVGRQRTLRGPIGVCEDAGVHAGLPPVFSGGNGGDGDYNRLALRCLYCSHGTRPKLSKA